MAVGTILRCIFLPFPSLSDSAFTIFCHICAILNGIAGIIVCSAPPAVSAAWFPVDERVTATSIGQLLNSLGGGLSFLLASSFIKESSPDNSSSCDSVNNSMTSVLATPRLSFLPSSDETSVRTQIQFYMYSLGGPCIVKPDP